VKLLTTEDLGALLAHREPPCISLFLPTHRTLPERAQDPIRYRNLVERVEEELRERPERSGWQELVAPLRELDSERFWRCQADGLAVYRAPCKLAFYRLPLSLPERVEVGDRFHVKPLLPSLQGNDVYYALHLSQNEVALYRGTAAGLSRLEPAPLPSSIRDALGLEEHIRHVEWHVTVQVTQQASKTSIYHGHGGAGESRKDDALRFVREVADGLWRTLRESRAPLVLVGVDYYHPLFRQVNRYPYLAEEGVEGNLEHATLDELHAKTWPIVERLLREREEAAAAEVAAAAGAGRGALELAPLAAAVVQGRVRTLLLARGVRCWGELDPEHGAAREHAERGADSQDLCEELAQAVLQRGGEVLVLPLEQLPSPQPWAAAFRW
jgi:hypothetical protein